MKKKTKIILIITIVILLMSSFFITAFAAFPVTTRNTTHWFYKLYRGSWGTLKTPRFYNKVTGQEYYCVQPKKDFPASTYYSTSNIISTYSSRVKTGLQIILQNGYPYNYMGLNKKQARYITANAIRSWLSENGVSYQYAFMNLGGFSDSQLRNYANSGEIPNKIRANGYNSMLRKMVDLLIMARNQNTYHTISMTTPSMSISGNYFVGTARITLNNMNRGYTLKTSALPSGTIITGNNGDSGDNIIIKIPMNATNANKTYTLTAIGSDYRNIVNLFAYAPSSRSKYQIMLGSSAAWSTTTRNTSVSFKTPQMLYPDLIISSLTSNKSNYENGETITVTAKVKNKSGQNSSGFYVSLSSVFGTSTRYVSSLNVGATKTISFSYTAPAYASNKNIVFTAKADHHNQIVESNESNNTRTRAITINRALPDLFISSLTTNKTLYEYGETITVTARVKNKGNISASSFYVQLSSVLGTNVKYVSSLLMGATKTLTFTYTAPHYNIDKNITFTAFADYNNRVSESNENNNTRTREVKVNKSLPDYTITSLAANKSSYEAGEIITVSAVVKNIGKLNASSSKIQLTIDDIGTFVKTVGTLNINQSRTVTFTMTAPTSLTVLTLNMTAKADYNNAVLEMIENNNTKSGYIYINALRPDITIINNTIQNWYSNKSVCVSATVKNLTAQPVPNFPVSLTIGNQTYVENICIDGNGTNLVVFRFVTPVSGNYSVKVMVDLENELSEIDEDNNTISESIEIVDIPQSYVIDPDDTSMEQRFDVYGLANLPSTSSSDYHTWQEVRYENGNYVTKNYWAKLTTIFNISPDSRLPDNGDIMESGYGISCFATTTLTTNYDNPQKLVGIQNVWIYYPESCYGSISAYENVRSSLQVKTGSTGQTNIRWQYRVNPYSVTNSKLHYTPLFFPDGTYIALSQSFYAWSPLGQMYSYNTDTVTIMGNMYDRLTNIRR